MNIVDIIIKKRDGGILNKEETDFFVSSSVKGEIADYQISAMLMAIFLKGLNHTETALLTDAMAHSGETYDLSEIKGIKVDKHSTGGVGDTTTLILAPLVASLGVPVFKMSGKGLGFSGGTIDKLESIPGFNTTLSKEEAIHLVSKNGIVIMGQSQNLTPADKIFYSLRDVTGTVESIPLIVSSIMSKKLAAGADSIVLDVKCGSGAFMKDYSSAKELAMGMVEIGRKMNRKITAVISSMAQPLGNYIGNSLEVIEAIEVLKGNAKGDLLDVSLTLGACMLKNAEKCNSLEEGRKMLAENIENGKGLEKLKELIIQQGGNPNIIDDYSLLPHAKHSFKVLSTSEGYITEIDASKIGRASVETGAGRRTKADILDYGAGLIMKVRLGEYVNEGNEIAEIFASSEEKSIAAQELLLSAIKTSSEKPSKEKLILDIIE